MSSPPSVSVAIIAKNEEDRIGRCLNSLGFADEVIVLVDSDSSDDTAQVARSKGCRVVIEQWRGFAAQKQAAVDLAGNDWVLILDADEVVPEKMASGIQERLAVQAVQETETAAYSFLRKNFFHGRWIRRCGWWPDRVVRLVNRKKGRFSDHQVHEHWKVTDGGIVQLNLMLEHHSFRNYADMIDKLQRYSTLSARQLKAQGQHVHCLTPPLHGIWTFLQGYVFTLGLLEGLDGLVISLLNGGGSFFKYAKLRELWQQEK